MHEWLHPANKLCCSLFFFMKCTQLGSDVTSSSNTQLQRKMEHIVSAHARYASHVLQVFLLTPWHATSRAPHPDHEIIERGWKGGGYRFGCVHLSSTVLSCLSQTFTSTTRAFELTWIFILTVKHNRWLDWVLVKSEVWEFETQWHPHISSATFMFAKMFQIKWRLHHPIN